MDVLRENIGLLQLPYEDEYYYDEEDINEGFLGFGKKKSRWQRFKDAIGRNKGKIAAGALGLGAAAWTGNSLSNYGNKYDDFKKSAKAKGLEYHNGQWTHQGDYIDWLKSGKEGTYTSYDVEGWRPWKSYSGDKKLQWIKNISTRQKGGK